MTYAVTGSTGQFGSLAIRHLLNQKVPAASIVAVARNEGKAAALKAAGVTVRVADYNDQGSLTAALKGVDRLLLVSGNEFGQRAAQHGRIIQAAKAAGVKLIAYTSVTEATTSTNPVAPEHKETEDLLKKAGVPYVLLRNNWYHENYVGDAKHAVATGTLTAAVSHGKVASASRSDLAEAAAKVLVGEGHAGKTYELGGAAWTYPDFARVLTELGGKPVKFQTITFAEREGGLKAAGLPEGMAGFFAAVDVSIDAGTLALATDHLEKLLGRKPTTLKDALKPLL